MDWQVSLSALAASVTISVVITVLFCWLLILWAGRRYPQFLLYLLVLARMDDLYYPLHAVGEPGEDLSAVMRRRRGHREYVEDEEVEMESLLNDSGTTSRGEPVYDSLLQLHSLPEDNPEVRKQQQQQPSNPATSSQVVAPLRPVLFSYGAAQHNSSTPSPPPPPPTATADASPIRQLSPTAAAAAVTVPSPASPNTTVAHPTPSVSSPSSPPPTSPVPSAFSPGCLEEWSAQQDLQASTQQYIMVKRIGWGGFSSVYQVQRRTDHHLFALKYLMLWCEEDREAAMAECHTLIRLQGHPNIVKVVDAFTKYEWSTASSAPSSPAEAALTVRSSSSSGALGLVKMPAEERQRNLNLHRAPYPPRPRQQQQQLYRHPHYGTSAAAAITSSSSASSSFSSEGSSCYLEPLQPVVQQLYNTSSVPPSATSGLVGHSSHGLTHTPLIHRRAPPPLPSSTIPLSTRHHRRRRHQQQHRLSTTTATLSGTTTHSETPSTNSSSAISSSCKVMRPLPSQSATAVGNLQQQQQQQLFVSGYTSPTPPATLHYTNVMFTTGKQQQQRGVAPGSAEKPTGTSSSCRSGGGSSSTPHLEGAEGEGVDSGSLTATSSPAPPPPPKFLKAGQLVYAGAAEDDDGITGGQSRTTTAATAKATTTITTAATVPVLAGPSLVLKGSHTRHHHEDPSSPIVRDGLHDGDDLDDEAAAHLGSGGAIPRRVGYLCLIMAFYPLGDISQYIHRRQMMTSVGSGFSAGSSTHPPHHHHHLPPLKSLTEPQILSVAYQIADALHHLHSGPHPVVHRDLKPENVLLKGSLSDADEGRMAMADDSIHGSCCSNSRHHHLGSSSSLPSASTPAYLPVVVSDFGLTLSTEQARHRHSGGTQPYIAPEVRSSGASPASDVWSLGCVLYAIATARLDRHNVRVMCDDAKREGFVSVILNDILSHQYSLNFASFVVSLLAVAPSRRPTAANIMTYFMIRGEGLEKEVLFDLSSDFFCSVSDL